MGRRRNNWEILSYYPKGDKLSKAKLKPCPFCRGKASKDEWKDGSLWSNEIVSWYSIGCSDCDYHMNFCGDEERAISTWNSRPCWIPMETPPKEFKDYFVLTVYGTIKTSQWREALGGSWEHVQTVTHWMEIPTLPEGLDKTLWKKNEYRLII
jgi:hypothetical protein